MVSANIEIYNGRSTIIGFVLSMFNPIFIKQQELKFKAIVCLSNSWETYLDYYWLKNSIMEFFA